MDSSSVRSKRRRLMPLYVSPGQRPDLSAIFESLNDDTLTTVLEFVGNKSYRSFGGINKHCKEIYVNTKGMKKETYIYGYAPLSVIRDKIERAMEDDEWELHKAVGKGVVLYNRRDVLAWAVECLLEEQNTKVLSRIFHVAAEEGRIDLLDVVLNNVEEDDIHVRFAFFQVDIYAASHGKLNVLKWLESKELPMNEESCAHAAARLGHLHILKWLQEEQGLELDGRLYYSAINRGHLYVMKWLRKQEVDWDDDTFREAAEKGNLDILQWLHDEGCPWPDDDGRVHESLLKPEVVEWCRVNGFL